MEAGNDENQIALLAEENAVREDTQFWASDVFKHLGKLTRICCDTFKLMFELIDKTTAQTGTFLFVPVERFSNFTIGNIKKA